MAAGVSVRFAQSTSGGRALLAAANSCAGTRASRPFANSLTRARCKELWRGGSGFVFALECILEHSGPTVGHQTARARMGRTQVSSQSDGRFANAVRRMWRGGGGGGDGRILLVSGTAVLLAPMATSLWRTGRGAGGGDRTARSRQSPHVDSVVRRVSVNREVWQPCSAPAISNVHTVGVD